MSVINSIVVGLIRIFLYFLSLFIARLSLRMSQQRRFPLFELLVWIPILGHVVTWHLVVIVVLIFLRILVLIASFRTLLRLQVKARILVFIVMKRIL